MAVARVTGKTKQRIVFKDSLIIIHKADPENVFQFAHQLYEIQGWWDELTKADIDEILEEIVYA
jgi:hypothetical protein